jgi:endonuclease/exonuclease/phosphatase family metal-dependent hydrolase
MAGVPRPRVLLPLLLLLAACAAPRAAPLRVATWNVENLFDEEGEPWERPPASAQVERKLERLGAVLRELDADVVALQEVENLAILARLAAGPLAGAGYRAVLVEGDDPRGIDVGVLARAPVRRVIAHRGERDEGGAPLFSRDPLEVHLETGGRRLVLVTAHLVSKRDGPAKDGRRERQARRLREIVDRAAAADPAAVVVLAGDLNDLPASAPLAPLLGDGAWTDVAAWLAPGAAWTYVYRGRRERLDYVLVARRHEQLVSRVQAWALPRPQASDHRPIVVDLELR